MSALASCSNISFSHSSPGILQQSLQSRSVDVASRETAVVVPLAQGQQCDLVLIDEAHLIPRSSNTMYRRFLDGLKHLNPLLKVIGLTATPYRLDSGLLHEGEDAIFTDVAYEVSVRELIGLGYLSPPISKRMVTELDVTGVGTRGGEFIAKDLAAAIDKDADVPPAGRTRGTHDGRSVMLSRMERLYAAADRAGFLQCCTWRPSGGGDQLVHFAEKFGTLSREVGDLLRNAHASFLQSECMTCRFHG